MTASEFLIYLVIILVVVLTIVVVIITLSLNRHVPAPADTIPTTGAFLAQCATSTSSCQTNQGLSCDPMSYLCKKTSGQACESASDCVSGLICSGVCTPGPYGELNQPCPCNTGYSCDTSQALHVCKGEGGTTCTTNADCLSDDCQSGQCTSGIANASPCTSNAQCSSKNCSNGFCQPPGVATGTVGASCTGLCTTVVGATCSADLSCQCKNGPQQPGTCSTTTSGILSLCSTVNACSSELVCYQSVTGGGAELCTGSDCSCRFPYTEPNFPPIGIECIEGMVRNAGTCQNTPGLGCQASFNCASGLCSGPAVVSRYQFEASLTPTSFLGSVATTIRPLQGTLSPWPNLQPRRFLIVPDSDGVLEDLYLIDPAIGIISSQVDLEGNLRSPWSLILASSPNRQVLDAAYNGSQWLFVIRDTTTPNTFDLVYSSTNFVNLVPFNVQTGIGLPGTQYTTGNTVITIDYIDYSRANSTSPGNDVLLTSGSTVYRKLSSETHYSIPTIVGGDHNGQPITVITGPAMFYYDNGENMTAPGPPVCPSTSSNNPVQCPSSYNIGFISSYTTHSQILNFSGDIAGWATPIDTFTSVNYQTYQYGIYSDGNMSTGGVVITLNNTSNGPVVALTTHGQTAIVPGWVGPQSLVAVGRSGFYLFSPASCA